MKYETALRITNILIVILIIALLILVAPFINALFSEKPESIEDVANSCLNLPVDQASSCVVQITKEFYKYNIDNASKELDFSTLRDEGGVCASWSGYYNEIGTILGYKTKEVIIPISGNIFHEFSVWSDEEGYCVLDQTESKCTKLQ